MSPRKKNPLGSQEAALGARLRSLRIRCRLSLRGLADAAGVSPSYIAGVEAARISPTIATLRKLLGGLGCDLAAFLADETTPETGRVFRRERMRIVCDGRRTYTFVLPQRADVKVGMIDEELFPGEVMQKETLKSDIAGYVVRGEIVLDIEGEKSCRLRAGDAFYCEAGKPLCGRCSGDHPARVIAVVVPPRF